MFFSAKLVKISSCRNNFYINVTLNKPHYADWDLPNGWEWCVVDDFAYVAELGRKNPRTMILFFTKNYKGINKYLTNNEFPENVKTLMSF